MCYTVAMDKQLEHFIAKEALLEKETLINLLPADNDDFTVTFDLGIGYYITSRIDDYNFNFGKDINGRGYVAWITNDENFYFEIRAYLEATNANVMMNHARALFYTKTPQFDKCHNSVV